MLVLVLALPVPVTYLVRTPDWASVLLYTHVGIYLPCGMLDVY